jgi:hypothetical protein
MKEKKDIVEQYIERNAKHIKLSEGGSYSTYMPSVNTVANLSSFAKSR